MLGLKKTLKVRHVFVHPVYIVMSSSRDESVFPGDKMTTAALSNNLNELDVLLQVSIFDFI